MEILEHDWSAVGRPVTNGPDGAAGSPARPGPPITASRLTMAAAALIGIAGIVLAATTPSGGGIALPGDDPAGGAPAVSGGLGALAGRAAATGPGPAVGGGDAAARPPTTTADETAWIVVDVAGAVLRPGIVRLRAGSRVGDAIAAAGGWSARTDPWAAAERLNLAAPVADGEKVLVPSLDTPGGAAGGTAGGGSDEPDLPGGGRIDLRSATAAELEALPGIGPVTAGRIVAARDEQPFASVDDLRARGLVGAAVFEEIRGLVTAGG